MKASSILLCFIAAGPVFAGEMADVQTSPHNSTYVFIGGGYYGSLYQANFTSYRSGVLASQESFNDTNSNGYGQAGLGASAQIGSFLFDHQLSVSKQGGSESFTAAGTSDYSFSQQIDFGYDFMPKMNILQQLSAYGILGAHYARFTYQKTPLVSGKTSFDNSKDQIGFNLGAGLNYQINPSFTVGVKYQHLQYGSAQVNGIDSTSKKIDIEQLTPSYNLVGVDLRYYFN